MIMFRQTAEMVLREKINTKDYFLIRRWSSESVPDLSLPPCTFASGTAAHQLITVFLLYTTSYGICGLHLQWILRTLSFSLWCRVMYFAFRWYCTVDSCAFLWCSVSNLAAYRYLWTLVVLYDAAYRYRIEAGGYSAYILVIFYDAACRILHVCTLDHRGFI